MLRRFLHVISCSACLTAILPVPVLAADGGSAPSPGSSVQGTEAWAQVLPEPTLDEVDRLIEGMRASTWTLPQMLGNPPPDADGRTVEDDIAQYLLTDETLREFAQARGRLAAAANEDGTLPQQALAELASLLARETCRIWSIGMIWTADGPFEYHADMIQTAIDRLPAERRQAASLRLAGLRTPWRGDRKMLEEAIAACSALKEGAVHPLDLRIRKVYEEFTHLRSELAAEINRMIGSGEIAPVERQRDPPCPAPSEPALGEDRVFRIRSTPDAGAFYPADARLYRVEGIVRVQLHWDAGGCVTRTVVVETSGSEELDQAAIRIGFAITIDPAIENGKAVGGSGTMPVRFSLQQ
jgi:TonB family protein